MRVLILNQTFHPDVAATAQHMWDLARYLASRGHQVTALASRNAYGTDNRAFPARECVEGIEIVRVGGTALGKKNLLARMSDFATFYLAAVAALARMPAPDVIVALTSPPMISTVGAFAARCKRTAPGHHPRFVYYVMDLYPEAAVASGVLRAKGLADRLFAFLTRRTLARADAIVALGRDMEQLLIQHYGEQTCRGKITIATPWADGQELFPISRQENPLLPESGLADSFNVVYSGNLGIAHDLETIVQAIDLTREDAGLRWVFIGGGKRLESLKSTAAAKGWKHVRILPYQDRKQLNQSLNMADVHLISQLPAFTGIVVPSKLFGIMAVGRPSIMIGPADCECSRILAEHNAGLVIPNGDAEGLVAAVRRLRADQEYHCQLGANARKAFLAHHDCQKVCARLEQVICG